MPTKVKGPKGVSSVSFAGEEYAGDKRGFFSVPDDAAPVLVSHGFTVIDEPVSDEGKSDGGAQ